MNAHVSLASRDAARTGERPILNVALQGTGAHGAFGWGVLDRLLEDGGAGIEGVAATGSGALNAVVCAFGYSRGGRQGARDLLGQFWKKTSERTTWLNPVQRTPMSVFVDPFALRWFEGVSQFLSPYEFNPLNFSPMRAVLEETVDFGLLRRHNCIRLALSATHVRSGRARIFVNREISADVVLAASCLPTLSQAVELDGEHYWDGTYSGQSGIAEVMHGAAVRDLLIAEISPVARRDLPRRSHDIRNRMTEIALNGSLLREARAVAATGCAVDPEWLLPEHRARFLPMHLHAIRSDAVVSDLALASKFDSSWPFLTKLRDAGRLCAEMWLDAHSGAIGHRSSFDALPVNPIHLRRSS